ncbi:hybrid sensor histidine kinase/response regulator [Dorea longicatena]|jgi:signal transduction histidine kinase/ActR/RegA family two-component response regulator|uniref:ATP-binding response regulator n=1 Tax=Dorea longicatena TaxID=88431 RepID=UPI0015FCC869|nr:response regulator [Dorea longicatena]
MAIRKEELQLNTQQDMSSEDIYVLKKLFTEYVSLYRLELNSGKYEILRLVENTNAKQLVGEEHTIFADYDEFTRRYADAFVPETEQEEFLDWHKCENLKKRLQEKESLTYYYHSVSKDGKDSYYEAYAVKGKADGKNFYIFLGYRNVDVILYKEKAIQEQLQKALDEAKLSNEIIEAIAKSYQYISRIDIAKDWFEEIANRDAENMNYKKSGEVTSGNRNACKKFVAEEYQEAFLKFADITTLPVRMKNEETIVMEYQMKDGNWHKLRFIEKKRDKDGNLTHVLCAIRSISDVKKKEQELLQQVAEARKDAALKSRFLSNMSHDIRTPINGIIGMTELADRYPDNPEIQKKCREKLLESARHLVSMVNDILDMNKLETEQFVENDIPFNLAAVLNRVNTDQQMQAGKKKIDYVVDWKKSELNHMYLMGNPVYIEKLLTVITDNAVKFTKPGGNVSVWCREISEDDERAFYEFGCSDNGIGMSEEFAGHAFEMFSQENKTSRTQYEGTGFGLAIAKKITERLGGTIEIKSKKNCGTTVTMTIPFKTGVQNLMQYTENVNTESTEDIPLEGLHALIAEDNELNLEIAKLMLEEKGICVECAADGKEAVAKFEESEPGYYDVIFMDIMMPYMNGWDATRKIRTLQRPDADKIPIIAMSANAFAEDIINSHISGMNWHLTKPIDADKLMTALKECIRKNNIR